MEIDYSKLYRTSHLYIPESQLVDLPPWDFGSLPARFFYYHKSLYVYDSHCRSSKADTQHSWKVLLYHTAYEIFYLILQIWLSSMIFCGTPGLSKPSSLKFDTSHPPVTSFYLIQSRVHIAQFVPCVHKPHIFSNISIYRCFFARSI